VNTSDSTLTIAGRSLEGVLREVVERLAPIDRTPCSPGEREAAEWLAGRLRDVDGVHVDLEDEPSWGTFPPTSVALGSLGLLAAALAVRGRARLAGLLAATSLAGIVDEAQNGPRIVRRAIRRRRETVNVVARLGALGEGARTLVVIAHHDAPQTGMIFDQSLQRKVYEVAPQVLERFKTPPPQWWIGLAGPLSTIAAALTGRRAPARAGFVLGALAGVLIADIWRNETVQGANDNLSGVAALVALAEMFREHPIDGLQLMLVSCGAEETLQDGIRAFIARHRDELDPRTTCFVNLDTVGSPHLVSLEAEGPVWMESYCGPWMRDEAAAQAERLGIELVRGYRARASTDSVIPSRAGYPIITLVSMTDWFSPANYHLPSDVPENLIYASVADATRLTFALAQHVAERPL
jgi:Peptidase family M28